MLDTIFGNGASHRMTDLSGAFDGGVIAAEAGLVAGTRVATRQGWRPVEAVNEGDEVLTFDEGMKTVVRIRRTRLSDMSRDAWPLRIPANAIGNRTEVLVLPDQLIVVENDAAEALVADAFAPIRAAELDGVMGISRVRPTDGLDVVTLFFDDEQMLFTNSGAMFVCPAETDLVADLFETVERRHYAPAPAALAQQIVAGIVAEFDMDRAAPRAA